MCADAQSRNSNLVSSTKKFASVFISCPQTQTHNISSTSGIYICNIPRIGEPPRKRIKPMSQLKLHMKIEGFKLRTPTKMHHQSYNTVCVCVWNQPENCQSIQLTTSLVIKAPNLSGLQARRCGASRWRGFTCMAMFNISSERKDRLIYHIQLQYIISPGLRAVRLIAKNDIEGDYSGTTASRRTWFYRKRPPTTSLTTSDP